MVLFKKVFFLLFTTLSDQYTLVFGLKFSAPVNNSLASNPSVLVKLNVVEDMIALAQPSNIIRHRRNADIIKWSFALFAKRLWRGFRRYLEGKTVLNEQFGSDRLKKIINLSKINNNAVTDEVLPFLNNMEVETFTESISSPPDDNYQDHINQTTATDDYEPQNIFYLLREKWKYQLVPKTSNITETAVDKYLKDLSESAAILYETLNKSPHKTYLWKTKLEDTPSSDYTTQFQNLYKLTLAYGTNGTDYFGKNFILSSVIDGLDFMVTKKGYDGDMYHGDWWHWIIGVPDSFIKIIMIIYDELSEQQRYVYLKVISNYISYPLMTNLLKIVGAYKMNMAETILALGILLDKEDTILLAKDTLVNALKPVNEGDGFYTDGSFIQNDTPYTGFYGKDLIKSLAQILFITQSTKYQLDCDVLQASLDIIDLSFLPLIFEGEMMAMVSGRAISRAPERIKIGYGSTLLFDFLTISKCAPDNSRKKLREAVRYWIRKNPDYYIANTRNYNDVLLMIELLNDSITEELPFVGVKLYSSMDRFVQRASDYMLGLALHSDRISAFDSGIGENKRGWHTADGMVYLYNDDDVQFNTDYWPTIDPYRLPGTTVDTIHLGDELFHIRTNSVEKWAGGVTYNNQAVIGMSLNKEGTKISGTLLPMNLKAKKSWFVVDGQIVALGAGITGNTEASIETIIENRLLNDQYDYLLISNTGLRKKPAAAALRGERQMKLTNVQWILLQESAHQASIGYYFPTAQEVNLIFERRSGTYCDINDRCMSTHNYTGNYTTILFNHGKNPVNANYDYVILPGITKHGLIKYIETSPITILANSEDIQAIKIRNENYIGINIWKKSGATIADVSCNKPASIIKQIKGCQVTYVISDPTHSANTIQISIPAFTSILRKSESVEYDGEYDVFVINFVNRSSSHYFTVRHVE